MSTLVGSSKQSSAVLCCEEVDSEDSQPMSVAAADDDMKHSSDGMSTNVALPRLALLVTVLDHWNSADVPVTPSIALKFQIEAKASSHFVNVLFHAADVPLYMEMGTSLPAHIQKGGVGDNDDDRRVVVYRNAPAGPLNEVDSGGKMNSKRAPLVH